MTSQNEVAERDEVLFAFHQACERPTAQQIIAWVNQYPQFAEDIRRHAAIAWDCATHADHSTEDADETLYARAYSQALNLIYSAEPVAIQAEGAKPCRTFQQLRADAGKETYQIARELDVGRSVLADLFNGWMKPPICNRLVIALQSALGMARDEFDFALQSALNTPHFGHAKANQAPSITPRTCEEIIRSSNMSPERQRYWLEED